MKIRNTVWIFLNSFFSVVMIFISALGRNRHQSSIASFHYYHLGIEPVSQQFFWWAEIFILALLILAILRVLLWNMEVDEDEFVVRLGFLPIRRINFTDIDGITARKNWRVAVYKKGKKMPFAVFYGGKNCGAFLVWMGYRGSFAQEPADFRLVRQLRD